MRRPSTCIRLLGLSLACIAISAAEAQLNSGSDGSDGVFHPQTDICVDLSKAHAGCWYTASPVSGEGVYDADKWAVVYKYSSVTIPAGVTITFSNHPKGAPVVWLVQGDVLLAGQIILDGSSGDGSVDFPAPGPGGFGGGRSADEISVPSGGFGPGGANQVGGSAGAGGGYATEGESTSGALGGAVYGNAHITPLIGGSGGGAGITGSGGGGGGALLIAANGQIQIASSGLISAKGGNGGQPNGGGGSGGAIRLIAQTISGNGTLRAVGGLPGGSGAGDGGFGRIRLEALEITFNGAAVPTLQHGVPDYIFPPVSYPKLNLNMLNERFVPLDPAAGIGTSDLNTRNNDTVVLTLEAWNIPVGVIVSVHVKPEEGESAIYLSTPLVGSFAYSTATVELPLQKKRSEVHLEAQWSR